MLRVVMAGPLPPTIGGMTTVIDDISRSSLARQVELTLFDTAKRTPQDRSLWRAARTRFALCAAWWTALGGGHRTIAHIHTCSGLSFVLDSVYGALAKLRGVPVVLHVHGARFDAFLDGLAPSRLWLVRQIARRADAVVVLSGEWQKKLRERLPAARLVVIENGVGEPRSVSVAKRDDEILVLFLGNLCRRKGVWDLVASAARLPATVRVVMVGGEEDPGIAAQLRAELARLGLEHRVELAGPAVGEEKFRWLARADIFVLPSYAEGVPISMLEALAAGLPAIVTPVGGIPSVLEDGAHALFVQPGDQDALVAAVTRLAEDAGLRARLGQAAKRHVEAHYGIESTARKYLRLYATLKPGQVAAASAAAVHEETMP
jgi:glycosyltransferase involved in cell wall biosynthesis